MTNNTPNQHIPAPVGGIEPHANLLTVPSDDLPLYKIMKMEDLVRLSQENYLHFNRVDRYADFPWADPHDGQQLSADLPGNSGARFEGDPDFSAANYYDQSRARTYACCFSIENSKHIWDNYANGSDKGKVGVVFNFLPLRSMINRALAPGNAILEYNGQRFRQIFSVNYGIVQYIEWDSYRENSERLPNQIMYTYFKDREKFSKEKEFRISLSAIGIGEFALKDGSTVQFPSSLRLAFDFRSALANGAIRQILYAPDSDYDYLLNELRKLDIEPANDGAHGASRATK